MLINLRNALMTGKRLPYDAEVEFLESTGTQWINSGIIGAPDVIVEATFAWGDGAFAADNTLIGSNTGSNRFIPITTNRQSAVQIGAGSSWTFAAASIKYAKNTVYTARSEFVSGAIKFILDGTRVISKTQAISNTNLTMYIFTSHESSTNRKAHAKLYSMKIYQNGVLVRDYIPVRVGTVGYLYDRVSGKLFGNAGTGDFVLGQDVVPVEYIESSGTQYIDTGVCATGATNSEFLFKMSVGGFAFGARTAWNTYAYSLNYATWNYAFNYGNHGVVANLTTNVPVDANWHTAKIQSGGVLSLDEWTNTVGAYSFTTSGSLVLFGTRQGSSLNQMASGFKYCKIWEGSTPVRDFISVRVGTDATSWEGAMMDVLTRRVYRNAGTGAFTYGNDLKYPIPAS